MIRTKTLAFFILVCNFCIAQNVPILNYNVNVFGQVELEIEAQADQYYILRAQHEPGMPYESVTSLTLGVNGTMVISEPLGAYPEANYTITAHSIADPADTDGDGVDDITELNGMPAIAPLNFADEVPIVDGRTSIDNHDTFSDLAVVDDNVPWAPFLNDQEFVKFAILNQDSDEAEVYFINSQTHNIHASFLGTINTTGAQVVTGEVIYNPNHLLPNGTVGGYLFNYSFGNAYDFEHTSRTYELLARNMPFLTNNLQHFIGSNDEDDHEDNYAAGFVGSRIPVILESQLFANIDYIPFNRTEGYGFFRHMSLDDNPGSRDIVLYDALPNSLPRVGGIITSVVQTPLSHVNLRAIQDNVPNAYIREPLEIDSIAELLNNYIYYKVADDGYEIREATLDEVNEWYENLRPTEEQIPVRDLSITNIMPLDSISFHMSSSFGAKCSNVATMRTFGFPEGTIPDGFGVPFYFYDEFMTFNNFYEQAAEMMADPDFINDLETRIDMLKDFRRDIKDADMPQWMLDELQVMHESFPEGTSVRCRSSTNNEDLPGFSGAGLYTSKTQHPHEGHMSKSIKQVYASMWNFRAFDEREFYRVDHFMAAMGVLCHPNFEDEKSNGVGVSIDPIYETENTFYLNTQVGESLVTNPDANVVPEEMLLNQDPAEGYTVLRYSNLVPFGELVMDESYLDLMRDYLGVIHDEFAILYDLVGVDGFGMDIEYKVTSEDQLVIKQARPWVSFWADIKATHDLASEEFLDPQSSSSLGTEELVSVRVGNRGLREMTDFDISLLVNDQVVETLNISDELSPQVSDEYQFTIPQDFSAVGDYNLTLVVSHEEDGYSLNDTLHMVLSSLYALESGLTIVDGAPDCDSEVRLVAQITNYGEADITSAEIEVVANGMVVDMVNINDLNIPYQGTANVSITVTDNLVQNNEISLNLLSVNGQQDNVATNNNDDISVSLDDSPYDYITLVINADSYPQETSWQVYDEIKEEVVASAHLTFDDEVYMEDICVDYSSCLTLTVFDSFGDGICCSYGEGNFFLLNSVGDTLATNNGEFEHETSEYFCPNGEGCAFTAQITTSNATDELSTDGTLTIETIDGDGPFQYSIDGGETFSGLNTFSDLSAGIYTIVIHDFNGICSYEEEVMLEYGIVNSVDDEVAKMDLKVFPNPTEGVFTIAASQNMNTSIKVEIYDHLGRLLHTELMNGTRAEISLENYPTGSYIAKCYSKDGFEKYFKVIKM